MENRSAPPAPVVPEVPCGGDVPGAVAFLCEAFGFTVRLRIGTHRAQLTYGTGNVIVTDRPEGPVPVWLKVADVDAVVARAAGLGAVVHARPADHEYGERQAVVVDPWGNRWTLSQSIADVDPASFGATAE